VTKTSPPFQFKKQSITSATSAAITSTKHLAHQQASRKFISSSVVLTTAPVESFSNSAQTQLPGTVM
jgi:hypothetical protein